MKIRYNAEDVPKLNLKGIRETGAFYFDEDPDVIYVECEPESQYTGYCPKCGCQRNYYSHGFAPVRRIHDISIGMKSVDLMFKGRRYKCNDCGETFTEPVAFADPGYWMTNRLLEVIQQRSLKETFKDVAAEFGLSIMTVERIFVAYASSLDSGRVLTAPEVLGIDEVHIKHAMRLVMTDSKNGQLLEMYSDNKQPTVEKSLYSMKGYENIKFVTMDMHRPYKTVVNDVLPNAKIIVDKFHVVRYLYSASHVAKKKITDELKKHIEELPESPEKDEKLKLLSDIRHDGYMFKFSTKKITENSRRAGFMAKACAEFPELNELRLLKIRAEKIYGESTNEVEAEANYKDFVDNIPKGDAYADFRKFASMIKRWKPEILNYFKYGMQYTNAATEGVNSLIKHINSKGCGYSFEVLRLKCINYPKAHNGKKFASRRKPDVSSSMNYVGFFDVNKYLDSEIVSGDTVDISTLDAELDNIL